ncbi:helicase POLQ-like isoform X1 [Argonauta hians]
MTDDDIDEGPCRKAKVHKRNLSYHSFQYPSASRRKTEECNNADCSNADCNNTELAENSLQCLQHNTINDITISKMQPGTKHVWFKSAFSEQGQQIASITPNCKQLISPIKGDGRLEKECRNLSSTPLYERPLFDDEGDLFEDSDADLVDLNITEITSQYDEQKNPPLPSPSLASSLPGNLCCPSNNTSTKLVPSPSELLPKEAPVPKLYETPPDEISVVPESIDLFPSNPNSDSIKSYSTELFSYSPVPKSLTHSSKSSIVKSPDRNNSIVQKNSSKPQTFDDADCCFSPTRSNPSQGASTLSSSITGILDSIFGCDDLEKIEEDYLSTSSDQQSQVKGLPNDDTDGSKVEDETKNRNLNPNPNPNPNPSTSSFLKRHIRQCMMQNAQGHTSQNIAKHVEKMQQNRLAEAKADLEVVQREKDATGGNFDIGPFYGLPSKVKELLEKQRGIKKLYAWQEECLSLAAVSANQNLIYSLPTSGGKTLVAEILILRQLLCQKKNAILILPYVSIVQEKVKSLALLAVELNFHVEEYAGTKGRYPPINRHMKSTLYIATIEKAHSLINQFIELNRINTLGLMVVDELHMLGEGGRRGATLEATLIKTLCYAEKCQIVGMSATLSNIQDLQTFLKAELYQNNFRPITLTEYVKLDENIYRVCPASSEDILQHHRVTTFQYKKEMSKTDPDHLLGLVLEVIPDNSCLLFCSTKKNCENVANMLTKMLAKYKRDLLNLHKSQKKQLLKDLKADSNGHLCPVLGHTIPFGLAYHHSGLTSDERSLIEEAYSTGVLCLLTCTSTLAAGVNLPAKRVILRSPYVGRNFISRCQYLQMIGRAGRAGIDDSGESILVVDHKDKDKVKQLIQKPMESCHSSLGFDDGKGIRLFILSLIGLQIATDVPSLFLILSRSLLSVQCKQLNHDVNNLTQTSLQSLLDLGLVIQKRKVTPFEDDDDSKDPASDNLCLDITDLGRATYKGSIDIDVSQRLYRDLKKSTQKLVVSNYLHLLALTTPYDLVDTITLSWIIYFKQMSYLNPDEIAVANALGITENYIARKASNQVVKKCVDEFAVQRFYLTLMLFEIWQQKTVWEVAELFQQPRGFVQNLVSSAVSFASCISYFCKEIQEFWGLTALLEPFMQRLSYSTIVDLIPLLEIPGVKKGRALQLHNAGYKTLARIAKASVKELVKDIEHMSKRLARQIIASASLLLEEKREALLEEIEQLVTVPEVVQQGQQ